MNTGGGFIKAYSNNWLSQFGLYKYENPAEPPRKPNATTQHRKIALYGVLAMAFVLFFILFVIINQSESDKRQSRQMIVESFSNETSIEPSLGKATVLTTPLSSSSMEKVNGGGELAEARKQRRIRRLGGPNVPGALELNDNLVLFPSAYLKPPRMGSIRRFSEDHSLAENAPKDVPRPFGYGTGESSPMGFVKRNQSTDESELGHSMKHSYGLANNIQDVLKQLTSSKNQNYRYVPPHLQQPSEFNNPVYRNHRVKFTGIYRHPRKNGDITTLFGAASRQHELQVAKPQILNSQLAVPSAYMPDSLYNFRPAQPSDVNLLATDQFRFAPENGHNSPGHLPKEMPFSVMLDILPMASDGPHPRRPTTTRKRRPTTPNYSNVNFPSYFNNQNFAQVKHALYDPHFQPEPETYYRSSSSYYHRPPKSLFPAINHGKLMVHMNLYPKPQEAARKFELEKTALDINHLQLSPGERLPDPERHKALEPTEAPPLRNYLAPMSLVSITSTTTEIPGHKRTVQNVTFPNDHVAMGRHPPYGRLIKRRHQELNWELDPRGGSVDVDDFYPAGGGVDVIEFDAGDAV